MAETYSNHWSWLLGCIVLWVPTKLVAAWTYTTMWRLGGGHEIYEPSFALVLAMCAILHMFFAAKSTREIPAEKGFYREASIMLVYPFAVGMLWLALRLSGGI